MSFYVTLPSNVSFNLFPENKVSDFTTALQQPLYLNGDWCVALVKISYRNSIDSHLGTIEVDIPSDAGPSSKWLLPLIYHDDDTLTKIFERLKHDITEIHDNSKNLALFGWAFDKEIITDLKDKHVGYRQLIIRPTVGIKLRLKGIINDILKIDANKEYTPENPLVVDFVDTTLSTPGSFFIYTDFIEEQIVGDSRAQLLETISISSSRFNHTITEDINNPHYVNVSKSEINTININIKDSFGENIHFSDFTKVIIKLHFKPKKYE